MKRNDLIGGLFFLAVGLLFTLYSRSVDIGTWEEPGPGFLPFWAGLAVIGMAVLLILKSSWGRERPKEPFFPERDSWKRVLSILLALVGYNLCLKPLGFMLVTFLFVGFLVRWVFPESWTKSLATAVLSTVCVRLIFVSLLEINFPRGFLGF